jgi:hypothetical protein
MDRRIVFGVGAVVLVVAAVLFMRSRGGGDDAAGPEVSKPADTPNERTNVALRMSGEVASTVTEDDPEGELRLEGQVVDADENGVAGALVIISSNPPRTTTSEDDGSFFFDKLVGRPYQLTARGDLGVAGPVTARLSESNDPVILRLRPAAAVEVTVVSADTKKPVANATVELRRLTAQSTTTDAEGVASIRPVVPGGYELVAHAEGHAKSYAWMRVPTGQVTAVARIALRRGVPVSGKVVSPAGTPVEGAAVLYEGASDWSQEASARFDAVVSGKDGSFEIPALPPGSFRFVARHADFAEGQSELVTLETSAYDGVVIEMKEAATVRGIVVSTEGEGMGSSRVRVAVVTRNRRWGQRPREVYTDDKGRFEIKGLPRKELQLVAVHETASSAVTPVDVTEGSGDQEVTLTLDVGGTIAGTVVDTEGNPVEGAQVSAFPASRENRRAARTAMRMRGFPRELTDSGGGFVIRGLDPGQYNLRAMPSTATQGGWRRARMRDETPAETGQTDVEIVLEADGSVSGTVALSDGGNPDLFTVGFTRRGGGTPFASADGAFTLEDMPAGSYTITLTGPDFDRKQVSDVEVTSGKETDLGTITVSKGRVISGRVTSDGSPVAGATVSAGRIIFGTGSSSSAAWSPPNARNTKTVETDDDGVFRISGVGRGDLAVVAEHDSRGRSVPISLPATNESSSGLELALEPFGAIGGTVTRGGKPAGEVRVTAQSQTVPGAQYVVQTGEDGVFRFDRLATDRYKVSARSGDRRTGMGQHSISVELASGATKDVTLVIDAGDVTLSVVLAPSNAEAHGLAQLEAVQGDITPTTARELTAAVAAAGDAYSQWSMVRPGEPATFSELPTGDYTICATPYPVELGRGDMWAYNDREGDNLAVFCTSYTVAADPKEQNTSLTIAVPDMVPLPDES